MPKVVEVIKEPSISDNEVYRLFQAAVEVVEKPTEIAKFAKMLSDDPSFFGLYGFLDGSSVSCSNATYICELLSRDSKSYNENLNHILSDPSWLIVLLFQTIIIAGISLLGNRAVKTKDPNQLSKISTKIWPYLRDILKGAKNGYKGTKGFVSMTVALEMISKQSLRGIALPAGLIVGSICVINRVWNRRMNNARDVLSDQNKKILEQIRSLNGFLQDRKDLEDEIANLESLFEDAGRLEQEIKDLRKSDPNLPNLKEQFEQKEKQIADTLKAPIKALWQEIKLLDAKIAKTKHPSDPLRLQFNQKIKKLKNLVSLKHEKGQLNDKELAERVSTLLSEEGGRRLLSKRVLKLKIAEKKAELQEVLDEREQKDGEFLIKALSDIEVIFDTLGTSKNKNLITKDAYAAKKHLFDTLFSEIDNNKKDSFIKSYKEVNQQIKQKQALLLKLQEQAIKPETNKEKLSNIEVEQEKIQKEIKGLQKQILSKLKEQSLSLSILAQRCALAQLEQSRQSLSNYHHQNRYKLLISNAIAGTVDAPYLYVGVMSLAAINSALIVAMSSIICTFIVVSVLCRVFEEQEKQRDTQKQILKSQLAEKNNQLILAQESYCRFERENPSASEKALTKQYQHVRNAYKERKAIRTQLKKLMEPSYYKAIMLGTKDGLSGFGAIASVYYAINIVLTLSATAFPPALVIGAIITSLAAIIGFCSYRLYKTYQQKSAFKESFAIEKAREEEEERECFRASLPLGYVDCNSDGLTKGEIFGQELSENTAQNSHELVRASFSGTGKSMKLIDFTCTTLKEQTEDGALKEPGLMVVFSFILAAVYGAVLGLRAFAKGFKNQKQLVTDSSKKPSTSEVQANEGPATNGTTNIRKENGELKEVFESNQPPSRQSISKLPSSPSHASQTPFGLFSPSNRKVAEKSPKPAGMPLQVVKKI